MPRVLPVLDARWVYSDAAQAVAESGGRGAAYCTAAGIGRKGETTNASF